MPDVDSTSDVLWSLDNNFLVLSVEMPDLPEEMVRFPLYMSVCLSVCLSVCVFFCISLFSFSDSNVLWSLDNNFLVFSVEMPDLQEEMSIFSFSGLCVFVCLSFSLCISVYIRLSFFFSQS